MDGWRGRVALVTGASAGIGASIAQALVMKGMKVVACAQRLGRLEEMAREVNKGNHGGQLFPFKCDLADMTDIKNMFDWIEKDEELGKVDVCICNAGIAIGKPLMELTLQDMQQMMNVNVISASLCTQLSINLMLKNDIDDGQIIFISSTVAHPTPDDSRMAFYTATKHALKVLLEGYRNEFRDKNNLRFGSITPGFVKTEAIEAFIKDPALSEMIYASTPHMEASDVSNAVMSILATKAKIEIQDIVLRHVNEAKH